MIEVLAIQTLHGAEFDLGSSAMAPGSVHVPSGRLIFLSTY
jgi:hypothetical protein